MEGLQIATYNNKVIEIVPDYRLKETSDGTITITRDSVEQATYAPFSGDENTEGMYIQNYSINEEGRSEKEWYEQDLLVAIVDLNYRFLTPTNPESDDPNSPENKKTSHIISENGCVEIIGNTNNTINRGDTYEAELRTKTGFARLPKGRVEMQVGENEWETKDTWENKEVRKEIIIPNVTGNLRFVFDETCVYNLTINRTLNGEPWQNCPFGEQPEVTERLCGESIDVDTVIKKTTSGYLIESVTPDVSGTVSYCGNTEIVVNYTPADSILISTWYDMTNDVAMFSDDTKKIEYNQTLNETQLNEIRLSRENEINLDKYKFDSINPASVTGDGSTKTVFFNYEVRQYTVEYEIGEGVEMADTSTLNVYYEGNALTRSYSIKSGYDNINVNIIGRENATVTVENGIISVIGVKGNVKVILGASSAVESIKVSEIDAMGGAKFTALFTNGTSQDITNNITVNSYKKETDSPVPVTQELVENVYDYSFKDYDGTTEAGIYTKLRIPELETEKTNSQSEISFNVTYNGLDYSTNTTTRRGETYGYYTGIDSDTNSTDLMEDGEWVNRYLVDFGDSCDMYIPTGSSQALGLDIYNKDITPYYIPGTDIGENPLDNLDDKAKFAYSTSTKPEINYNKPRVLNEEHYHILWHDLANSTENVKGKIYVSDSLSSSIEGCGGYDSDCGCSKHSPITKSSLFYTLEARLINNDANTILKNTTVNYKYWWEIPQHNYGRDSISYYHCNKSNYGSKVVGDIFRSEDETVITDFSYPVHIYINVYSNNQEVGYSKIPDESYKLETVRWGFNNFENPDNDGYNYYSNNDYYYDYKNKIKTGTTTFFDPYDSDYFTSEDKGSDLNTISIESNEPNDKGRIITEYYTIMSPEKQVRPIVENNEYKFIKLSGKYNGANYLNDRNSSRIVLKDLSEYIINKDKHTTYVSPNFENSGNIIKEPKSLGISDYLYTIDGVNKDYSELCSINEENVGEYSILNTRIGTESATNYYPYRWYNMKTNIKFSQYCNSESNAKHYLRNDDDAKYVACASEFVRLSYYYYRPIEGQPGYSTNYSEKIQWWINNFKDITEIRALGNSLYEVTIAKSGTILKIICTKGTVSASTGFETIDNQVQTVFCEQELTLPEVYTNAKTIKVEFLGGCSNTSDACGVGSFKVETTINKTPTSETTTSDWVNPSATSNNYFEKLDNNNEDDAIVRITANTNTPGIIEAMSGLSDRESRNAYIKNNYGTYYDNIKTGGGRFKVTATWVNGDTRTIVIDIGGSCKCSSENNHPNKEGCKMLWGDFVKYYKYYSNNEPYDNRYLNSVLDFTPVVETTNNEQLS